MYIIYNADGSINKQYLNEFIQQGNNYANVLFVAIIGKEPSEYYLEAFAKLPNGVNIDQPSRNSSMIINGIEYFGKSVSITQDATISAGNLQLNVVAENLAGTERLVTFNLYITVNETGLAADDPAVMTIAQYQSLLNKINEIDKFERITLTGTGGTLSESEYEYIVGSVGTYIKLGDEIFWQNEMSRSKHLFVNTSNAYKSVITVNTDRTWSLFRYEWFEITVSSSHTSGTLTTEQLSSLNENIAVKIKRGDWLFDKSESSSTNYVFRSYGENELRTININKLSGAWQLSSVSYDLLTQPYAEDVIYDNSNSGLEAGNVQGAIDEIIEEEKDFRGEKEFQFVSCTSYTPQALTSTFNGWLLPMIKKYAGDKITSISTVLTLEPATIPVKCLIMDANKNIIKEVVRECNSGEEVTFDIDVNTSLIPTDEFRIGFVSDYAGDGSRLMIAYFASSRITEEYNEFIEDIETAYATNKGVGWDWMNNVGSKSNKERYFKVNYIKYNTSLDEVLESYAKKEEVYTRNELTTNSQFGKENYPNVNLFDVRTISPAGEWYSWANGKLQKYPDNQYIQRYCHSDFIEIDGGQNYMYSGGNPGYPTWVYLASYCFYDENKVFISGAAIAQAENPNGVQLQAPANAKYITLSFVNTDSANAWVQLEKGNVKTAYQPYYGDLFYLNNVRIKENQVEKTPSQVSLIRCADKYDLVVGDTFELFYKGVLEVYNEKNYNVLCQCDIGKCFERKFVVDNITTAMIGSHNLIISLYDNNNNLLENKNIELNVANKTTSPTSEKVILCMGDSLTASGIWVDEFARRLTKTTSQEDYYGTPAPQGLGLSNIKFIGKKTSKGSYKYEGFGGWSFANYISTATPTMYWLTAVNNGKTASDQESIWQDANGIQWQLETIETDRLKFKKYSGTGVMPSSGTLTWVSGGTNTNPINFTASTIAEGNPFVYNGVVDFASYCADMGVSTIDEVYILLGWNNATSQTPSMADCQTFINLLRNFNPNVKIVLMGLQIPSLDGCGNNYGASGIYSKYYDLVKYVHNLDDAYKSVADSYVSGVYAINISAQFDTEYNMPSVKEHPNTRNLTEIDVQNNGVHPANSGYFQIADAVYRWFNANN